jgi:UDP-2-acetamido-2,6-beta-L-arabino-hexul-4-ose reductase
MRVLVTGARGMVGTALCAALRNVRDGGDRTRPGLRVDEVYEQDRSTPPGVLDGWCAEADFVFHLAGVNRPDDPADLWPGNVGPASDLLARLERHGNACPVMLSSSVQASLAGRYAGSAYGRAKRACEGLFFGHAERTGARAAVYRLPNVMGHSRPNYNSAVSTFCWAVANGEPYTVDDPGAELELLHVGDLVRGMLDLLEGGEERCRYEGARAVPDPAGPFCRVPGAHRATLGEVAGLLERFREGPGALAVADEPEGSLAAKLHGLYLTYLPTERFARPLETRADARGGFTELLRGAGYGQVSVNVCAPGATRGNHWHASKWEVFFVVKGRGLVRERNVATGEAFEAEVSGDRVEAVRMVPGWAHSITNLSDTEDLVTVIWASEPFDPQRPDTYHEEV